MRIHSLYIEMIEYISNLKIGENDKEKLLKKYTRGFALDKNVINTLENKDKENIGNFIKEIRKAEKEIGRLEKD